MATIYQRVLGERFELLPPALRQVLGDERPVRASGRLTVTRAAGRLRNLAASALGIPPAGEFDLLLEVLPHVKGQRWVRRFGGHTLTTVQGEHQGLLVEWSGPASIGFELLVEAGVLRFRPRRAWLLGVPLPLWLTPGIEAENWPGPSGGWGVRVCFRVPLLGQVAAYEGNVTSEALSETLPT